MKATPAHVISSIKAFTESKRHELADELEPGGGWDDLVSIGTAPTGWLHRLAARSERLQRLFQDVSVITSGHMFMLERHGDRYQLDRSLIFRPATEPPSSPKSLLLLEQENQPIGRSNGQYSIRMYFDDSGLHTYVLAIEGGSARRGPSVSRRHVISDLGARGPNAEE